MGWIQIEIEEWFENKVEWSCRRTKMRRQVCGIKEAVVVG